MTSDGAAREAWTAILRCGYDICEERVSGSLLACYRALLDVWCTPHET
jgi:hypothetical protein